MKRGPAEEEAGERMFFEGSVWFVNGIFIVDWTWDSLMPRIRDGERSSNEEGLNRMNLKVERENRLMMSLHQMQIIWQSGLALT